MNCTEIFNPIDLDMKTRHNSIVILNNFKQLGFTKRDAFINTINSIYPKYNKYPNFRILENFWSGRYNDALLNSELINVLDILKNE